MAKLSKAGPGKPKPPKPHAPKIQFQCIRCGRSFDDDLYYKSVGTHVWRTTGGRVPICRDCLQTLFDEAEEKWDEQCAVAVICHYLDIPFDLALYTSLTGKCNKFDIGIYVRMLNGLQYTMSSFANSFVAGELFKNSDEIKAGYEESWTVEDQKNKNAALEIIGYDPFAGYNSTARKFLFGEIVKYFDDDISEDAYKLTIIIQIVLNTYQISQYNLELAKLSPTKNADDIRVLQNLKKNVSDVNTKLAQDNEISVKNRSNKDVGKSTLTYLMRDLREKNFEEAEANYYDSLRSPGSLWAIEMSNRAILQNTMFDENDKNEIFNEQRKMIQSLQAELDDEKEENRRLKIAMETQSEVSEEMRNG